ncbi:MAG: hypothetical protein U0Q55_16730 [Vicinamibacterales bacterium]
MSDDYSVLDRNGVSDAARYLAKHGEALHRLLALSQTVEDTGRIRRTFGLDLLRPDAREQAAAVDRLRAFEGSRTASLLRALPFTSQQCAFFALTSLATRSLSTLKRAIAEDPLSARGDAAIRDLLDPRRSGDTAVRLPVVGANVIAKVGQLGVARMRIRQTLGPGLDEAGEARTLDRVTGQLNDPSTFRPLLKLPVSTTTLMGLQRLATMASASTGDPAQAPHMPGHQQDPRLGALDEAERRHFRNFCVRFGMLTSRPGARLALERLFALSSMKSSIRLSKEHLQINLTDAHAGKALTAHLASPHVDKLFRIGANHSLTVPQGRIMFRRVVSMEDGFAVARQASVDLTSRDSSERLAAFVDHVRRSDLSRLAPESPSALSGLAALVQMASHLMPD